MKILICGEGAHDIGVIQNWSIQIQKQTMLPGWLQPLLNKFFGEGVEFVIVPKSRLAVLPGKLKKPLPKGHGQKAALAKFRAASDGCDLLVFMVDADTTKKKIWKSKVDEIKAGFEHAGISLPAIACVPMAASESWLLADSASWKVLGLAEEDWLPKKPEAIWGVRSDPASNHPHPAFGRVCKKVGLADDRDTRYQIMLNSSIKALIDKCPISFVNFMNDACDANQSLT